MVDIREANEENREQSELSCRNRVSGMWVPLPIRVMPQLGSERLAATSRAVLGPCELCQCQARGLATFNNRSLDLRRQKGQADEAAAIWRIRRCDEHGQSGIILVQHGVCGAELSFL